MGKWGELAENPLEVAGEAGCLAVTPSRIPCKTRTVLIARIESNTAG